VGCSEKPADVASGPGTPAAAQTNAARINPAFKTLLGRWVRTDGDYLLEVKWNKTPPAPALPGHVVATTTQKYEEALLLLTGRGVQ